MNNIAIVVVAYNRVSSVERLLCSLEKAFYEDFHPTLIISIDKSDTDKVEKFAEEYHWPYGEIIVRKHKTNLGLKDHMMSLGEWFERFDTLVVLEDDIVVSPCYFSYVRQASDKYMNNDEVCGISLYSFSRNYQTRMPFTPMTSEYDCYFMNCAMSWGEVWLKPQWLDFHEWYLSHQDFIDEPHLPKVLCNWSKSWLKYHTKYCIEKNKYFVYPYISLSTNYGDAGVHSDMKHKWGFQVPLQYGNKNEYKLPNSSKDAVCYDGFFENKYVYKALGLEEKECCVDLCGSQCNRLHKRYWLTLSRAKFPVIKSFALNSRPIEMSVISGESGKDIFLYDTQGMGIQEPISSLLVLFLYNLEEISVFVHQYGWKIFVKHSIKLIFRRR